MTTWDTWNPADLQDGTLSSGNTLFSINGGITSGFARATSNQANTGKWYFEVTQNYASGLEFSSGFGLAILGASFNDLTAVPALNCAAMKPYGFGDAIYVDGTSIYQNALGNFPQTAGIAVDFGVSGIWIRPRPGNAWNDNGSADPAAGTGGIGIAAAMAKGLLYPFCVGTANIADSFLLGADPASLVGVVPSGFTAGWPMHTVASASARNRGLVIT